MTTLLISKKGGGERVHPNALVPAKRKKAAHQPFTERRKKKGGEGQAPASPPSAGDHGDGQRNRRKIVINYSMEGEASLLSFRKEKKRRWFSYLPFTSRRKRGETISERLKEI